MKTQLAMWYDRIRDRIWRIATLLLVMGLAPSVWSQDGVDFNRDVQPILSHHCYECHGPDEGSREAGLRLDRPGEADFEEVLYRIGSNDESELMPPASAHKPLTPEQIRILKEWIEDGAIYQDHWAFQLPAKPNVPAGVHPVDYFVDRQLAERGLQRSPRADAALLIRRLYLDLTGLLPPVEVADRFIEDPSAAAYDRLVDQLLQSPAYGERWARRWLDLARYADTNGYEKDRDRSIWPYRDWVIRAINADKPFDEFTIEQIAGDMLPNATPEQRVATGFHRNSMLNEEGGIDPLEYRYYAMVDRVATTGATWLGMTIGCAQCHTHKFDPVTHTEYFSLMAYLNNTIEPDYFIEGEEQLTVRATETGKANDLLANLPDHWPESTEEVPVPAIKTAFADWLIQELGYRVNWKTLIPESMETSLPWLTLEEDGVIFAQGDTTKHDTYELRFPATSAPITAFRLEVLPDARLPGGGPGMTFYEGRKGDFFLAEIAVVANGRTLEWGAASETYARNQFGKNRVAAELATDGEFQSGWSVAGRQGFREVAVFNLKQPLPPNTPFLVTMEFGRHFSSSLGKFRLSAVNAPQPLQASTLTDQQAAKLDSSAPEDRQILWEQFLMNSPHLQEQADKIRALRRTNRGLFTLVMEERPAEQRRPTFVYHRGEFTQPGPLVEPGLPELFRNAATFRSPTDRLQFARWLVSRDNPLTARVVVNRQWAALFGEGLVSTLDDFGLQGARPTHPQLLDFLAVDLMDQGWSLKKLHRLLVTSETYQQSSSVTSSHPEAIQWLQRFPRRRLEAEIIRDTALQASGLLSPAMFGPPVRPPQPAGAAANFQQSKWQVSEGEDRFRRSIYTYQKRTAPFEMLVTFDATSGESCVVKRDVSNTPLQALTLLNDPMFLEYAEAFGNRMERYPGATTKKLEAGFRWLLTRKPEPAELEMLTGFYETHQDWTAVGRVLLSLDEAITRN